MAGHGGTERRTPPRRLPAARPGTGTAHRAGMGPGRHRRRHHRRRRGAAGRRPGLARAAGGAARLCLGHIQPFIQTGARRAALPEGRRPENHPAFGARAQAPAAGSARPGGAAELPVRRLRGPQAGALAHADRPGGVRPDGRKPPLAGRPLPRRPGRHADARARPGAAWPARRAGLPGRQDRRRPPGAARAAGGAAAGRHHPQLPGGPGPADRPRSRGGPGAAGCPGGAALHRARALRGQRHGRLGRQAAQRHGRPAPAAPIARQPPGRAFLAPAGGAEHQLHAPAGRAPGLPLPVGRRHAHRHHGPRPPRAARRRGEHHCGRGRLPHRGRE